MTHTRTTEETI